MIEVNNLTRSQVDKKFLKRIAQIVFKKKKKDLSIALVGQARIKELNRKYRKRNRSTDVLSFDYGNSAEVVICPTKVKENARKYGVSYKRELARSLIHSILHLLGYNHEESKKKAKKMEEKQQYYLSKL